MSNYVRNVFCSGETIVTTVTIEPDTVSSWISETRSIYPYPYGIIAGLDVEWRPSFVSARQNPNAPRQNPVATVQICVDRRCLIYQIFQSAGSTPQSLADFLADRNFVFVGVGVESDLRKLDVEYGIGGNARAVGLGRLAANAYGQRDLLQAGLVGLAGKVLGMVIEKPLRVTMSSWDKRVLTDEQVEYACIDAFVSFEIGRALNASENSPTY